MNHKQMSDFEELTITNSTASVNGTTASLKGKIWPLHPIIPLLLFMLNMPCLAQVKMMEFSEVALKMGSRFELIAVSNDSSKAHAAIKAGYQEIDRIEQLISSWIPESQTSSINNRAGVGPVQVDKELFELIYRSIKISELTNGGV